MLKKINDDEIMTHLEARKKYAYYYYGAVTIEPNLRYPHHAKIKVVYTADEKEEWHGKGIKDDEGKFVSFSQGSEKFDNVIQLGGVYIV
ncbi:MAG: hypothetical protein FWG64_03510 [Firmicutes bacterium]|nr:hypothetical protein [Bacillota bacterium]